MSRGTSVSDAYNTLLLSMQRDLWPILVVRPNTWQFTLFCNVFLIVCFCYTREQVCGDKSCQQRALCNQISRSGPGLLLRIVPQCLLVCCVSLECQSWFYRYTLSKVCWYVHKSIGRLTMSVVSFYQRQQQPEIGIWQSLATHLKHTHVKHTIIHIGLTRRHWNIE